MKRHESLYEEIIGLMTLVSRDNLEDLFNVELRRFLPAGHGFFKMTHQYLKVLLKDQQLALVLEVVTEGLI